MLLPAGPHLPVFVPGHVPQGRGVHGLKTLG
jgi:hypothetical protein